MRLTDEPSADRSINWIDRPLRFEHDTFAEIVAELKRYYNVDIRFMDDALRSERFSGDFQASRTASTTSGRCCNLPISSLQGRRQRHRNLPES